MASLGPTANFDKAVAQHDGQPLARDGVLGSQTVYIVEPYGQIKHEGCGLIIFPNGHGICHSTRLLADAYAGRGYLTVLVNTAGKVEDIETKEVHKSEANATQIIDDAIAYLKDVHNVRKIGAIGYCAGGTPAFELLSSGRAVAGFVAHPSHVTHAKMKDIKAPLSIASPEDDRHMDKALRDDVEGWLKDIGLPWQLTVYSGVKHGFGSRYPTAGEDEERGKRMAFGQAVAWIDEFLPGN